MNQSEFYRKIISVSCALVSSHTNPKTDEELAAALQLRYREDLLYDSLDNVELFFSLEDAFNIDLDDTDFELERVRTIQDMANYLTSKKIVYVLPDEKISATQDEDSVFNVVLKVCIKFYEDVKQSVQLKLSHIRGCKAVDFKDDNVKECDGLRAKDEENGKK